MRKGLIRRPNKVSWNGVSQNSLAYKTNHFKAFGSQRAWSRMSSKLACRGTRKRAHGGASGALVGPWLARRRLGTRRALEGGCVGFYGFIFSRPRPPSNAAEWFRQRHASPRYLVLICGARDFGCSLPLVNRFPVRRTTPVPTVCAFNDRDNLMLFVARLRAPPSADADSEGNLSST